MYLIKLKNRELITRRTYRGQDQLTLNPYKAPSMDLKNVETTNIETKAPAVQDNDANYLIVEGCGFRTEFNRENGYLIKYEVNGQDMIKEGEALTPNFWRARQTMISELATEEVRRMEESGNEADFS